MNFELSPRAREMAGRVGAFMDRELLPRHREWTQAVVREGKAGAAFMPGLQAQTRAEGLWNLALPDLAAAALSG